MNRLHVSLVRVALVAAVAAPAARAQSPAPAWTTDYTVAVGAALPQGDRPWGPQFGERRGVDVAGGTNAGFTVAGAVRIRPVNSPVSLRVEVQYARFGLDPQDRIELGGEAPVIADGHASILDGTANALLALPAASRVHPYLIGGVGAYRLSSDIGYTYVGGHALLNGAPSPSQTKFGLNGGAGLDFSIGALHSFVEARFHSVFIQGRNVNFIPITLGVKL